MYYGTTRFRSRGVLLRSCCKNEPGGTPGFYENKSF
jgi:hypothetical protein